MSNVALREGAKEILEWRNTGVLCDGVIRLYARKLVDTFDVDKILSLNLVENYVFERCVKNYLLGE